MMDREEAIQVLQTALTAPFIYGNYAKALEMAIEALSAEQKEEELAKDIARRMATIIENEQDMRVILKNASAEDEQGVGRYENAMQKLRDMPRYLNGVKEKQITKISTNYTTEKPNGVVEQKNDVVAEPTDLISRADAIEAVEAKIKLFDGDAIEDRCKRDAFIQVLDEILTELPSADGPSGEWVEKEVMVDEDANITEWQSAKCSVCGKYHTTPYMYYFDNFNHCPNCGAKMGGE